MIKKEIIYYNYILYYCIIYNIYDVEFKPCIMHCNIGLYYSFKI